MTRATLQQKIEEIVTKHFGEDILAVYPASKEILENKEFINDLLYLFIEFSEELIGEDEEYDEEKFRTMTLSEINSIYPRNELRSELRQKLAALKGEK